MLCSEKRRAATDQRSMINFYTKSSLRCPITTFTTYGITITRCGSDRMLFVFRPFTWSTIDERSQTNEHQELCDCL